MIPPDTWFNLFKAPFSGDVTQRIEPRLFSPDIAGVPEIEEHIHRDVASYGTQLGKILEALQTLSVATGTPLPEIDDLVRKVEVAKTETSEALRERAVQALERLRQADPAAHAALMAAPPDPSDQP
ncbi:hypothetical protein ATO6_13115 [Oceanicola sp. 22II-s10i]|uniref:hypothetical protein n=1 Tax=Oceanicola sp. 22II-s10i TaxID=1317116 RepID=UPI000B52218A|nr:hypothetical protein [Oceanicola sp. 22II-s10i]OWU84600.1 hypothetical protein ATO6_13115 [Oceanicola sp. 22II-s10i]